jgi:hypothetical protein
MILLLLLLRLTGGDERLLLLLLLSVGRGRVGDGAAHSLHVLLLLLRHWLEAGGGGSVLEAAHQGEGALARAPHQVVALRQELSPAAWARINRRNQCCGSGMFIPDPRSNHFLVSRIRIRPSFIPYPGSGSYK